MEKDLAKRIFEKVKALSVNDQKKVLEMVEKKATSSRNKDRRPIWEIALELSKKVPMEEWEKLPSDGAVNHDHYLYGAPKKY